MRVRWTGSTVVRWPTPTNSAQLTLAEDQTGRDGEALLTTNRPRGLSGNYETDTRAWASVSTGIA
jgi:hypothetical protein